MSASEFESLVASFLEGTASDAQIARLRAALGQSAELRARSVSYKEIAVEMGVTQAAVETLLFRARRTLAEALTHRPKERRGPGRPWS